ncbi:unnamed protein product [Boreogadus saida]
MARVKLESLTNSHPAHLHMLAYEAHPIPAISLPRPLCVPCGGPRETLLHGRLSQISPVKMKSPLSTYGRMPSTGVSTAL